MSDDPIYLQQTLRDVIEVLDKEVLPHMDEGDGDHTCPDCRRHLGSLLEQVRQALTDPNENQCVVSIDLGNAAMLTDADVADALQRVAAKIAAGDRQEEGGVHDLNGNTVGRWSVAYPSELAEGEEPGPDRDEWVEDGSGHGSM